VGDNTVAIHWDYAREVLQKADGVLATVGLEADLSAPPDPVAVSGPPGGPAAATMPAAGAGAGARGAPAVGGPSVAPGAGSQSSGNDAVAAGNIDK
jgi:hypothetical protein